MTALAPTAELAERLATMPAAEAIRGPKDWATIMVALRQAARIPHPAVQSTPVSYRWRQPGNKHWIYDPTPAWIEDHKHEIELEALYLGAAQASPEHIRQMAKDAIRTFCRSLSPAAVQMSHGAERIYYSGISLDALAVAVSLALTRPGLVEGVGLTPAPDRKDQGLVEEGSSTLPLAATSSVPSAQGNTP